VRNAQRMNAATTADIIPEACTTVASVVVGAAGADLESTTPCTDFSLRALLSHFTGTTGAFAKAGKTHELDADDPWGSTVQLDESDWPETLAANLDAISVRWSQPETWHRTIRGSKLPAQALGELALIEVLLHGWDIAQTTGQQIKVSDVLGAELYRCVAQTAEQGREFHVYGPEVAVADVASDFDKALGLAGRDPAWHR
jgi:uncharacterized protein (TIGR03086 family)